MIADAHLRGDDETTDRFLRFLRSIGNADDTVILAGDIFDLWVVRDGLEMPFHWSFLESVADLRRRGIHVKYIEGNRDYFVAERYGDRPFSSVIEEVLVEDHAGRRIHIAHGDLLNTQDLQYRRWRRLSRSTPARKLVRWTPGWVLAPLFHSIESRLRTTNTSFRMRFPVDQAKEYAQRAFDEGCDFIVLGHFHEERVMEFDGNRRLYVVPGWHETYRYLRIDAAGEARFEAS